MVQGTASLKSRFCNFRAVLTRSRQLSVLHYQLETIVNGPPWPRVRVVFASDFHAGLHENADGFRPVLQAIEEAGPDVLLLGGDYVSSDLSGLDELVQELSGLRGTRLRFAVLGDHDTRVSAGRVRAALESAGCTVLINQNVRLPPPHENLVVVGLDDVRYGSPDVTAAFGVTDGIRLVLAHSPAALALFEDRPFRALFCGHTHGGQVALPGGIPIYLPHGRFPRRFAFGRFEIGSNLLPKTLIVSRGIGCSLLPIRLFAPPDIVICDFLAKAQGPENF